MGTRPYPNLLCILLLAACGGNDSVRPDPRPEPEHTLAVHTSPGVTGAPAAGESRHRQGTRLTYSFSAQPGYEDLIVTLDGTVVPSAGGVLMDTTHALLASARPRVTLEARDEVLVTGAQAIVTGSNPGRSYQQHIDRLAQLYRTAPLDEARRRVDAATLLTHDEIRDSTRIRAAHMALGGRIFWVESPAAGSVAREAHASSAAEPVTILYINGIHNSPAAAAGAAAEMGVLAREAVGTQNVQIGHFYNVSWLSRTGPTVRCIQDALLEDHPGIDLIGDFNRVNRCLDRLNVAEDLTELTRQLLDVVGVWRGDGEQDAKVFAAAIQNEIHLGRRVVIVAHSQGNLMTQQALRRVVGDVPPGGVDPLRCIGVLRLAPPSTRDWVSASTRHLEGVTIRGDIVFATQLNDMAPFSTERSSAFLSAADVLGRFSPLGPPARFLASVKIHDVQKGYLRSGEAGALVKTQISNLVNTVRQGVDCSGAQKQIFASSGRSTGDGPSDLYVVDPSPTGRDLRVAVLRTEGGSTPAITDLAWCPGGSLYGLSYDALYEVGVTTGVMRRVGAISGTDANSLTCSPLGYLYVGAGQRLLRIDRGNATITLLGNTQSGYYSGDLAFAPDGTLYGVLEGTLATSGNDYLVRVDVRTGRAERVGTGTLGASGVWGLTFIGDQLYGLTTRTGATRGNLIRISTSTGTATHVRSLSFNAFGSADILPTAPTR